MAEFLKVEKVGLQTDLAEGIHTVYITEMLRNGGQIDNGLDLIKASELISEKSRYVANIINIKMSKRDLNFFDRVKTSNDNGVMALVEKANRDIGNSIYSAVKLPNDLLSRLSSDLSRVLSEFSKIDVNNDLEGIVDENKQNQPGPRASLLVDDSGNPKTFIGRKRSEFQGNFDNKVQIELKKAGL